MDTATLPAVLAELEQRAGASDADRGAWLAERAGGITATQIRDLYLKKITPKELIDQKLGRVPEKDLSGVPVIAWGNHREPIIAATIQQRFNLAPESRVFHAADEPRFLASPDGVGVNFDEELLIDEIKTAGMDIAPWSDSYAAKGYEYQQQWGMRVTGARRCLYVWEERIEIGPNQFVAGEQKTAWVEYDEVLVGKLEKLARRFLTALEKAAAEPWEAPAEPDIDEVLDTHAVNYLRALDLEKEAKALKAPAWAAMLAAGKSQTSALARITYTVGEAGEVEEIDYEAAEAANPGLFALMNDTAKEWAAHCDGFTKTKTIPGKPTLRVTPVKTKEMGE